jgi:hypothetical protein
VGRAVKTWMVAGFLLLGDTGLALADEAKPVTRMSRDLASLPEWQRADVTGLGPPGYVELPLDVTGDWVTVDAVASGDPRALEAELISLGARNTAVAARMVSAQLPIAAIPQLEGVATLQFARPAYRTTNVGTVTSQGDHVLRSDLARGTFGVDGSGVLVGVLSDSFNCLFGAPGDVASGDLPAGGVTVLQEDPGCSSGTDEGRAMLQIVHDVAPGANLAFATASTGQAGLANNIRALRNAGAEVIVDDALYLAEPMFQDGVVAQAVDEVVGSGVAYFSSAGNNGRKAYDHTSCPGRSSRPGPSDPTSAAASRTISAARPCNASPGPEAAGSDWSCSGTRHFSPSAGRPGPRTTWTSTCWPRTDWAASSWCRMAPRTT